MPKAISDHDQIAIKLTPYLAQKLNDHIIMKHLCQQLTAFITASLDPMEPSLTPDNAEYTYLKGGTNPKIGALMNQITDYLHYYQIAILNHDLKAYQTQIKILTNEISKDLLIMYRHDDDFTDIHIQNQDLKKFSQTNCDENAIEQFYTTIKSRETISLIGTIVNVIYQFEAIIHERVIGHAE